MRHFNILWCGLNIHEQCQSIQSALAKLGDKQDIYRYIFSLGKDFRGMDQSLREDKYLVDGCISQAWLIPHQQQPKLYFDMDSEALIVRGLMSLLHSVYHGRTPQEILSVDLEFWLNLELTSLLSMNRRNGTVGMIKQILQYAAVCQAWWVTLS